MAYGTPLGRVVDMSWTRPLRLVEPVAYGTPLGRVVDMSWTRPALVEPAALETQRPDAAREARLVSNAAEVSRGAAEVQRRRGRGAAEVQRRCSGAEVRAGV